MTAIATQKYRVLNAKKFIEQAETSGSKNMYQFIGKSTPWTDDLTPETTLDTVTEDIKRRSDMIALKKIQPSNVSHVIQRFDYDSTGNTKYLAYDPSDVNLFRHPTTDEQTAANNNSYTAGSFYVLTDENNVYKCLFQPLDNVGVPKKSTVQPTGRSTSAITTADGYVWKYMYSLLNSEILKFMSNQWMPVKTLLADDGSNQWEVQDAAIDGSLDIIKVINQGVGYDYTFSGLPQTVDTTTSLVLPGTASAIDQAYQYGTLFVDSGPGAGTVRKITSYVGSSRRLVVDAAWSVGNEPNSSSSIVIVPSVNISGDGTGATARATVSGGKVTKIDMVTRGGDDGSHAPYRYATVTIQGCYNSGAGGATPATAQAIISPIGGHGKDAVQELGGSFIMVNSKLLYNDQDFPIANDYRRIGIIINVRLPNGNIATDTNLSAVTILQLDSVLGSFVSDEVITSNAVVPAQAKVIEFTSTGSGTGLLKIMQDSSTGFVPFVASDSITANGGATASVDTVNAPEVNKFSGDIIYVQNRRPIMRASDQIEDLKMVVEF